jgi:hypothetical protein
MQDTQVDRDEKHAYTLQANQSKRSCKIHDKYKPWCANKENYITQRATEPSKYHQLIKIC